MQTLLVGTLTLLKFQASIIKKVSGLEFEAHFDQF